MTDAPASDAASAHQPGVCAVVVTWQPDIEVLRELLDALSPQVGRIVVVDNATRDPAFRAFCAARTDMMLVASSENHGLAHAINVGIEHARGLPGVSHVLLMDQDSVPEAGMVDVKTMHVVHVIGQHKTVTRLLGFLAGLVHHE